jgi:hypothetical protein
VAASADFTYSLPLTRRIIFPENQCTSKWPSRWTRSSGSPSAAIRPLP